MEYFDVPQEAPAVIEKSRPPAYWPSSSGELVLENLVVKYAPDLPAVLRNLSFTVKPSEKIGVVCNPSFGVGFVLHILRFAGRKNWIW